MRTFRAVGLPALGLTLACAILAGAVGGRAGALGAVLGGLLVYGLFLVNPLVLGPVTKVVPKASIGVALLFFGTKVLLVLALLTVLLGPNALGRSVDDHAVVLTVVASTIFWMVLLVRDHQTRRLPIYDLRDDSSGPTDTFGSQ